MKLVRVSIYLAALFGLTAMAGAQSQTKPVDRPGHSEHAPGQRADEPGEAKKYAPGQMMKKKDDPKSPGASEYAPGQQSGTKPGKQSR